jgi:hypothetical protein
VTAEDVTQPCCYEVGSRVAERKPGMAVGFYSGEQTQEAFVCRTTMFQLVFCFILPIWMINQLNLLVCSKALFTDFQAPEFWINYDIHLRLHVKYFSELNAIKVSESASYSYRPKCGTKTTQQANKI